MSQAPEDSARAGRRRLLLVLALFLAPLLAAVGWYFAAPQLAPPPSVHGTLLDPARPLEPFAAPLSGGGRYTLDDLRGHWTLVHVLGAECDVACRRRLHDLRQVHDALGEDRVRVARIALAGDGADTPGLASILDDHPRLTVLRTHGDGPLAGQLSPEAGATGDVFVVDPLGNVVLRYGSAAEPSGMLDDLEKLLRLSRIG